jgi:pimeloyl-[acyl-carrier protein] methyl ester esterase
VNLPHGNGNPESRSRKILLVHGWASEVSIWDPLVESVAAENGPDSFDFERVDLGYFSRSAPPVQSGDYELAIGHSAGLQWLLQNRQVRCKAVLSVCGFTRFVCGDDFAAGWPRRILDRMARQLGKDPGLCVREFHEKGRLPEPCKLPFSRVGTSSNAAVLAAGLQALSNADCRTQWSCFDGPRAVLAATDDPIVDAKLTQSCFPDEEIEWIPACTHWLPMTHPQSCAMAARRLLARLDLQPAGGSPM